MGLLESWSDGVEGWRDRWGLLVGAWLVGLVLGLLPLWGAVVGVDRFRLSVPGWRILLHHQHLATRGC